MTKILTEIERQELLIWHKKSREKQEADRIKVVLLVDDGWSFEKIAQALFLDESTVGRHFHTYEEEKRLKPGHKGSKPLLSEEESLSLSNHLEENLYTTVKEIQNYIRKAYGKNLSRSSVYNWLKKHNFTYKKPKLVPAKVDPVAQQEFIDHYEALLTRAIQEDELVLFGDSVHPSQQTQAGYGWVKKGKEKLVETNGGRKRVNLMGALNLEDMKLVYHDFETINGDAAVEFLKKVEAHYPQYQKIHLIWDQAGYHTGQAVKDYLKITSRIEVHYLPPRSPNLNSIERLWKILHKYVSHNKYYQRFTDFKKSLFHFFDVTMETIFEELVSAVTDNFRVSQIAK